MQLLRKMIACIVLLATACSGIAQHSESYSYDDFFYYRHHLYLRTPSVLLNAAGYKAAAGDTSAAINLIRQAASKNMYDTGYIHYNGRVNFVVKTTSWSAIRDTIEKNRRSMGDPANMQVLTSDIDRFWKLYDKIGKPGADKLLMNDYIMKGSQGLRTFFEVRMGIRVTNIIETVIKKRKYFESIRPVSQHLYLYKQKMIEAATKLEELYPPAIFPPTTFSIGTFGAFGTADGGSGQLIGAEFLCDTNTVVKTELSDWERTVIADSSKILGILIHELIHVEQQTASDQSLLARAVNEGAADFITQLILGFNINSRLHEYGNAHEYELWEKFKTQMDGDDTSDWLYNGESAKEKRPGDLGYYMGYKICEAYYSKAADKKKAVADILTIQDFKKFLEESGYGGKVKN